MVGSDIGDINSPTHIGSRSTREDPKLLGKPSDFSGDKREWRHFEWVFRNWFDFLYDAAEEWLDQAANAPGELGEAVPDRRETDTALYMSLAVVCKKCEVGGIVQGDEGPVDGVAQVIGYHGVTVVVGHQEERQEEEVEKQGEVEGEGEKLKDNDDTWMECGWNEKTSASGLSHVV